MVRLLVAATVCLCNYLEQAVLSLQEDEKIPIEGLRESHHIYPSNEPEVTPRTAAARKRQGGQPIGIVAKGGVSSMPEAGFKQQPLDATSLELQFY